MKEVLERLIASFYEWDWPELIPRQIPFVELPRKATVVVGMRRTGKTSFCLTRLRELMGRGLPKNRILYLSFENEQLMDFTSRDFQTVLDVYYSMFPQNKDVLCYWVLDEIQRIENWEAFVRRVIDTERIQLILTGSSAKLLSSEIATALRGRSYDIEVLPFSFGEYLVCHKIFAKPPVSFGDKTCAKLRQAMARYLVAGGFPEVQGVEPMVRMRIQQDYVNAVSFRDVVERYRATNLPALRYLIRSIVNNPGQKFSVAKFYRTLQTMGIKCSRNDLYDYLDHLADAFLVYRVPINSESVRVQQTNPAKLYPVDTGLAYALSVAPEANRGALLETLVFLGLHREGYRLEYVLTPERYEVDFVATSPGCRTLLVQVCYTLEAGETREREFRALVSAGKQFPGARLCIVTWDEAGEEAGVGIVPVWRFLLEIAQKKEEFYA